MTLKRLITLLLPILFVGMTALPADAQNSRLEELDFDAPFRPAPLFSTLLNEGVRLHKNGQLQYGNITAIFLPSKTKDGEPVDYGIGEEKYKLTSKIYDASDRVIATMVWDSPAYRVDAANPWFRTIHPSTEKTGDISKMKTGDYRMEFLIEGDPFYVFPFSVIELVPGDAYTPAQVYGIDGAWNEYGYVYIANVLPDRPLRWKQWLRNESPNMAVNEISPEITGVLKRDGAVIGTLPNRSFNLIRAWTRYDFGFDNSEGYPIKGGDIFNNDGAYQIVMTVDGTSSTFSFIVKDGAIQHQGRQVREGTDPLNYIEGGRDAWWLRKE